MVSSTVRLVSWAAEVVIRTRFPSTVSCAAAEKRKAAAIPKAASRAIHFFAFHREIPILSRRMQSIFFIIAKPPERFLTLSRKSLADTPKFSAFYPKENRRELRKAPGGKWMS